MVSPDLLTPELIDLANTLASGIRTGSWIAWIGSGFSVEDGYPSWLCGIRHLCENCEIPVWPSHDRPTPDELMDKADKCKAKNPVAYCETLTALYGRRPRMHHPALHSLMRLDFKGYITTNFDPLLRDVAVAHEIKEVYAYPYLPLSRLGSAQRPVYYVHGLASYGGKQKAQPGPLILGRSDFDEAYGSNGLVRDFLSGVLTDHNVLFLACRLEERGIQRVFARVSEIHYRIEMSAGDRPRPERYILLPRPVTEVDEGAPADGSLPAEQLQQAADDRVRQQDRFYEDLGIKVFRYDADVPPNHRAIEAFLEYVCDRAGLLVAPVPKVGLAKVDHYE